ncbi:MULTISPECIES: MarR family winged helix-turn-helix transcriptional regulator [unclassified Herbaspirillum]|uniref:MarR family winged helix-turn-helix transcriptional regulator n=1 Tax=unclassified Herbaspirillum TaxID=2624150 RepID=UPI00114F204D|nr:MULTISPECIES: MarR family transcriptional regulator [unclassified Herbaspirillum]MBB5390423.1 DNA-binding MarR family transcriptional regulator [Herbaspirillum sp. SJZ102]TQK09082.1 DNA-binding MarR family transcriptional regulator [Herbaspirillum sp. SJZ130]TQK14231.1 DNA-binding MarR family transcriptional regulator [Herbaspirillum sp. SJZ106]TWC69930.1 DNA-binding MarR family transcriptional regulator [Herbaspirillum sp. SJZ099]
MKNQVDKVNQSPAADKVFEAIHTVMHLYRASRLQVFREDERGITHMESRVLDYFAQHPDATLSDLVAHSGRDKAQLTRLIRGLRDKNYLEAREDAQDRRSVRLQLSKEGRALQRQLKKTGSRILAQAVEGLSEKQCDELVALLKIVQGNLERQD